MKYIALLLISLSSQANMLKIGIIDTGLDLKDPRFRSVLCKTGHEDFTGTGMVDRHGHGTHVAGLIKKYAKDSNYCLVIMKFYDQNNDKVNNLQAVIKALEHSMDLKLDIVNMSIDGSIPNATEEKLMQNSGILFVVAAGNDNKDLDVAPIYPACYNVKRMVVVGAVDKNGKRVGSSNWGKRVNVWEQGEDIYSTLPGGYMGYMTGTSMATGITTGKIIYEASR